jgi:uncharacterized protein (DUF1330 family)
MHAALDRQSPKPRECLCDYKRSAGLNLFLLNLRNQRMKKGYWVVAYKSISDESAVRAYGTLAVPAVQSFGGRFLTRSTSQVQPYEAGLQQRTVIVEFDSYEIALTAHKSEAYQKALQALGSGAERDYRIVEGV